MSAAGPELPPHLLAKRKRQQEDQEEDADPAAPGAKRPKSLTTQRRARPIGPALPPAPVDEMPSVPADAAADSDSSDEDDDFGPAPPSSEDTASHTPAAVPNDRANIASPRRDDRATATKRDDWMTMPPKQDDLASRMDPTKIRARGFNTGKSAQRPSGTGGSDTWTETPEQKRKRLEDQVLGIEISADGGPAAEASTRAKREEDRERATKIMENRGKSLYEMHQKREDREQEDDPGQRAFDREKDINGGRKLGSIQKKQLMNNAANFGSKFSSGSFL